MYKVLCLCLFMIVFAGTQPVDKIVDVESYLQKTIQTEVNKECETCQVELFIHNKKILQDVAIPDQVISDRWRGQTNLVLKMGDENRIVTVTIRWRDQVIIAKSNIRQGQTIGIADVKSIERDVTFMQTPYLSKIDSVVGMEPRKIFKRGQVIDEGYLKKPLVVKYGQPVKVFFRQGSLELTISGQAKGAGAIGERIPVYLPNTKKRLSAVILAKDEVRVQ